jgi:hypothetical protein
MAFPLGMLASRRRTSSCAEPIALGEVHYPRIGPAFPDGKDIVQLCARFFLEVAHQSILRGAGPNQRMCDV